MPARRIELECTASSPLWTGGADQTIDRVHETGILGSMRWWFEAFLRGVGVGACDPITQTNRCLYDLSMPHNGICEACEVFGATGWRRRFRLTVRQTELEPVNIGNIMADRPRNPHNDNKVPTWYFSTTRAGQPLRPLKGNFSLVLDDLDGRVGGDHFDLAVLGGLLQFMADWAGIGARNQMGFGRFEITSGRQDTIPFYDYLVARQGAAPILHLPSLGNLFLATVRAQTSGTNQETFNLKHDLRQRFRNPANPQDPQYRDIRHKVMGTTAGSGIAAKVKMSWPDATGTMRVWGWLPATNRFYPTGWNRNRVIDVIHDELQTRWGLREWHAAGSPHNTHLSPTASVDDLLRFLLIREDHP